MLYVTIGLGIMNVLLLYIIMFSNSKRNKQTDNKLDIALNNIGDSEKEKPSTEETLENDVVVQSDDSLELLIKEFQKEQKQGLSDLREQADKTAVVLGEENVGSRNIEEIEYDEAVLYE